MYKIIEPIFILLKDTGEVYKYKELFIAERSIEAYDILNYEVFDSEFRQLKLYKKDKYNKVFFKLESISIQVNKLKNYLLEDLNIRDNSIEINDLIQMKKFQEY